MACEDLVGGGFAYQTAPFAGHPLDQERALTYLTCCIENGMTWDDARAQIQAYLEGKGVVPTFVASQLETARQHLQPWIG
jgi:hypothetical protein